MMLALKGVFLLLEGTWKSPSSTLGRARSVGGCWHGWIITHDSVGRSRAGLGGIFVADAGR